MKRGQTYRCLVCFSEVLLIQPGKGNLRPVCCNQPQELLEKLTEMYRCPVCASEIASLAGNSKNLGLICCNTPMIAITAQAA